MVLSRIWFNLDVATMILVLHHIEQPEAAIHEAARCLRPGGHILVADMVPHERIQYREDMGHVWLGFPEDIITGYLTAAGFTEIRFQTLPPTPEAKGPNLFAASARLTAN